jgi:hypothetical protein
MRLAAHFSMFSITQNSKQESSLSPSTIEVFFTLQIKFEIVTIQGTAHIFTGSHHLMAKASTRVGINRVKYLSAS